MENVAQAIRKGQGAATGAASITVEKHKNNFMTQHGIFEDKPSQNITRWLANDKAVENVDKGAFTYDVRFLGR